MIARCSAASRVPFGGSAALDAACGAVRWSALIAGHPAHALSRFIWNRCHTVWLVLLHLEHAGLSLKSMPARRRGCENVFVSLLRLMTKDPQAAYATVVERER